jgi:hypothetical protein
MYAAKENSCREWCALCRRTNAGVEAVAAAAAAVVKRAEAAAVGVKAAAVAAAAVVATESAGEASPPSPLVQLLTPDSSCSPCRESE